MITADQLVIHGTGDYITQSDWMAKNKTKSHIAAAVHAFTYSLPFGLLVHSVWAWLAILSTHFFIDRYRLARYVVWAKNWPLTPPWSECANSFGYPPESPAWLSCWLMIIADNLLHVVINGAALQWL